MNEVSKEVTLHYIKDFTSTVSGGVEKGFTCVAKNGFYVLKSRTKKLEFIWVTAS